MQILTWLREPLTFNPRLTLPRWGWIVAVLVVMSVIGGGSIL